MADMQGALPRGVAGIEPCTAAVSVTITLSRDEGPRQKGMTSLTFVFREGKLATGTTA